MRLVLRNFVTPRRGSRGNIEVALWSRKGGSPPIHPAIRRCGRRHALAPEAQPDQKPADGKR
jgi:hypothetical protein